MKIRTDFVTNSSSANYSVTLTLDGSSGQHVEVVVQTYDFKPWYEDTEQGFETYDRKARALSYNDDRTSPLFPKKAGWEPYGAQYAESMREFCEILLSAIHEYGWGQGADWWEQPENVPYFRNRWLRDRLIAARAAGRDGSGIDLAEFDRNEYIRGLAAQGKSFSGDPDNICEGWHFYIHPEEIARGGYVYDRRDEFARNVLESRLGVDDDDEDGAVREVACWKPRIYDGREELVRYIEEHGGTVDEEVTGETDFVIYPGDGMSAYCYDEMGFDGVYWTFVEPGNPNDLELHSYDSHGDAQVASYVWQSSDLLDDCGHGTDGLCDMGTFCDSFSPDEFQIDSLLRFESASDVGDIIDMDERLDLSQMVIPEHEFVRRFDPERERHTWMPYNVAHPLIVLRLAQVCEAHDITPQTLRSATYEKHVSAFGDSVRLLGFETSDGGNKVIFHERSTEWVYWGDRENVDKWYIMS